MTPPFCALCASDVGPFLVRPYGKDDAIVTVCERCETEHPRDGRYSFSEAGRLIAPVNGHKTRQRR